MTRSDFDFRGKPVAHWPNADSRFAALYLHDHLGPNPAFAESLSHRLNVLAPAGGHSWWTDRIESKFDATLSAERHVIELISLLELPVPRPRAAFGGEAAIRFGFRHPSLFPVVAGWDCAFDFHDLYGRGTSLDTLFDRREQARQYTAILQVRQNDYPPHIWFGCPADSEWFRGNDRLHEKLNAIGVPHEFVVADACPIETMADFLVNGLEKRSRRLL